MLEQEDLKWIASTSTDLNSMLQQILRYADLAQQHKETQNYVQLLNERVEVAARTAQSLFDRVTSSILDGSANKSAKSPHAPFTVLPTPTRSFEQATSSTGGAEVVVSHMAPPPIGSLGASTPPGITIENPNGPRELILVVDDEAEITELASAILACEGYKVITAKDGFEALKIYQRIGKSIGLVILDFFLPVIDGDAVYEELRALNPHIAVVLSSGFAEQSKVASMLAQGLRGFIPKPYTRQKLLEQVRSILDAPREKLA